MQPLSEAAFTRRLRALSAQGRLRFLARLWEARGYTTRVDDGQVIARRGLAAGDIDATSEAATPVQELTIVVTGAIGYGTVDAAADIVVTTRETALVRRVTSDAGAELVSPADLLERLLYGIDRETAKNITSEHLGGSLMQTPTEGSETSVSRWAGAVVIGVVVIAVVIGAAGPLLPMNDDMNSQDEVNLSEPVTVPTTETADRLPAGLSDGEVTDPQIATAAHNAVAEGEARELRFEYFTPGNSAYLGGISEYSATGRYANDSRYAFDVTQVDGTGVSVRREQFVLDGITVQKEEVGNETNYLRIQNRPVGRWRGFRQSTIQMYTAALSVNQTSVRRVYSEEEPVLRLDLVGTPTESFLRTEYIEAVAFVTLEGRLTRLQIEYTDGDTGDSVRVVVGVQLLEDSPVPRPEWYGTALNETA